MSEQLHIKGMPDDTTCEVHDWTLEDFRTRLVPLLRERHGKGGLNVCVECVKRTREELREALDTYARETKK